MSKPPVHAFFVGRAVAEALYEQLESALTGALAELGKFDAEQRDRLRQFYERIEERANKETAAVMQTRESPIADIDSQPPADLQATIDQLRAEIALVRSELNAYRSRL